MSLENRVCKLEHEIGDLKAILLDYDEKESIVFQVSTSGFPWTMTQTWPSSICYTSVV